MKVTVRIFESTLLPLIRGPGNWPSANTALKQPLVIDGCGMKQQTYERWKPSGAMILFIIVRLVMGPLAAKVMGIKMNVTRVARPVKTSILGRVKSKSEYFKPRRF
jgi:hypothetical protein